MGISEKSGLEKSPGTLKTYSHLSSLKKMPSEYELVTTKLLYSRPKGLELKLPVGDWYQKYGEGSPFTHRDWESFCDPRETTYTKYTHLQMLKEVHVNKIFESLELKNYDHHLNPQWIGALDEWIMPLRFPYHGFQMIAAYVGQMAPTGKITLCALFQAADEMRRIQRLAYRMRQLQMAFPGFGQTSARIWQDGPAFQPLRRLVEMNLVTYDWGEAFTALNFCLKPLLDDLILNHGGELARKNGDYHLDEIFISLNEDCQWQKEWGHTLMSMVLRENEGSRQTVQGWVNHWAGPMKEVLFSFAPLFGGEAGFKEVFSRIVTSFEVYLNRVGLEVPAEFIP